MQTVADGIDWKARAESTESSLREHAEAIGVLREIVEAMAGRYQEACNYCHGNEKICLAVPSASWCTLAKYRAIPALASKREAERTELEDLRKLAECFPTYYAAIQRERHAALSASPPDQLVPASHHPSTGWREGKASDKDMGK